MLYCIRNRYFGLRVGGNQAILTKCKVLFKVDPNYGMNNFLIEKMFLITYKILQECVAKKGQNLLILA